MQQREKGFRFPVMTLAVFIVTAIISVASIRSAAVLHHYERTPAVLHGQWWRTISSLFVQDGGWGGGAANMVYLLVLGILAEQVTGRFSWLLGYFGTGVIGEFFGYAWQPTGGGNSVAVCGLAGLVTVAALRRDPKLPRVAPFVAVLWCADMLATWHWWVSIPAYAVAAIVLRLSMARWRGLGAIVLLVALASAAVLCAVRNIHGAALLAGLVLAGLIWMGRGELAPRPAMVTGAGAGRR